VIDSVKYPLLAIVVGVCLVGVVIAVRRSRRTTAA
jgi:hypothetical protein